MKINFKTWLKIILSIIVFFISFYSVRSLLNDNLKHEDFQFQNPAIGIAVPSVKLAEPDAQEVDLRELIKGQKAIIFFWSSACPHCVKAIERQDKQEKELAAKGIRFLSINQGEEIGRIQQFWERKKLEGDFWVDINNTLPSILKIVGVPSYYFVNEKGVIVMVEHKLTKGMIKYFMKL